MNATDEVFQILRDAKVLARRYYHLTGKPLGVTGEIAEFAPGTPQAPPSNAGPGT